MERYHFKLEGPVLENNIPLHIAIDSLRNFQAIVDRTYLELKGEKKRLSKKERRHFQLRAYAFEKGSFITYFEIFFAAGQLVLPFMTSLGPQTIWDYTKESFHFLKIIFSASKHGVQPTYDFHDNKNFTVHIGDKHYHFHAPVYHIGESSLKYYRKLTHLSEQGVSRISAGRDIYEDIVLSEEDINLFDLPSHIDPIPIELTCEIFDFNKFRNVGKLLVGDNQPLSPGEYSFAIYGDQDNVNYIYSMLKPQVVISCLKESRMNPFAGESVFRLHITDVVS